MRGHRDLVVWQKAMELVTIACEATRKFPKDELYGLVSQLRRAAVSIPSNIAGGYCRNSRNEFHHFLGQARGSLAELETQIEIANNLGYLPQQSANELLAKSTRVAKMLTGLRVWSVRKEAS